MSGKLLGLSTVVVLTALAHGTSQAAPVTLSGKLWVIKANSAATFPPPVLTPDATFKTDHAVFVGQGPNSTNQSVKLTFTVGAFLNSAGPVSHLVFSGKPNPVTGSVVSSKTPLTDAITGISYGTYETLIEMTGSVPLKNGEYIAVAHADGVALTIDGNAVAGFSAGNGGYLQYAQFSGGGGNHTIDLLYIAYYGTDELLFALVP